MVFPTSSPRGNTMATIHAGAVPEYAVADRAWPPLARAAAVGVGGFFGASIIAGALDPGYDPVREAISALAATDAEHAGVMIGGFLLAAVAQACTAIALWQRFAGVRPGRIAAVLVMLAAPALVVCGLARQDCSERLTSCIDHGAAPLASTHFWVHQYVSLALFLALTVAQFLLARALRRSEGREHLATPTRVVALSCLAIIAVVFMAEIGNSYHGLFQRLFIFMIFVWPILVVGLPPRRRA